ncbi:MAG: hypothetical protein FJZ01_10510 [Candidatus Sericytochromatia bacterium]|nr:hypothetical protein [Candidatus Tanganyikabacteria bacterium]
MKLDSTGALYVADGWNHCIRKIVWGQVTTIAGDRTAGFVDSAAPNARFNLQFQWGAAGGLSVVGIDKIYISDSGNHSVRVLR